MLVSSPFEAARRYGSMLDPSASDSFAVLQQVRAELAEQGEADALHDGLVLVARDAVHDLIAISCADMAKAVPWDTSGDLKQVRSEVILLAKTALEALAAMDDPKGSHAEQLRKIAGVRREYASLVQELNARDRRLLAAERRRVS